MIAATAVELECCPRFIHDTSKQRLEPVSLDSLGLLAVNIGELPISVFLPQFWGCVKCPKEAKEYQKYAAKQA
jgi:hypothetical protein